MEETRLIKRCCIAFTLCLAVISGVLTYLGGIGDAWKILSVFLPPFLQILIFQCVNFWFVKLGALLLFWIPQFFFVGNADYCFLFLPAVSLIFAESSLKSDETGGRKAVSSLLIALAATLSSVFNNCAQFSLRSYFLYRWDKGYPALVLFAAVFVYLLSIKVKTGKHKKDEMKTLKRSKWILGIAIADALLGIETIAQFEWFPGLSAVYCLVWLLFLVGTVRFGMPQALQFIKRLKSE